MQCADDNRDENDTLINRGGSGAVRPTSVTFNLSNASALNQSNNGASPCDADRLIGAGGGGKSSSCGSPLDSIKWRSSSGTEVGEFCWLFTVWL